jgi:polar amino acid transport system permease protein
MSYVWQWEVIRDNWWVFVEGAVMTVFLTVACIGIGLIAGLFLGLGRISKRRILSVPAAVFTEVFRDTPVLVQLFWVFYCLPIVTGITLGVIESAILALSIQASAYISEVYRAGIQSIDKGQMEAARSLGMSSWQGMWRIVLPQAVRRMIPPFLNVTADFMKASSLASVVGVWELLRQASNLITNTWRPLEIYTAIAIMYFFLIYPVVWFTARVERHLAQRYVRHLDMQESPTVERPSRPAELVSQP